jgi:hypothetical protein
MTKYHAFFSRKQFVILKSVEDEMQTLDVSLPQEKTVTVLPTDDPFAAGNFTSDGDETPAETDDLEISVGVPDDEVFVLVSDDPRHHVQATLLVVKREDTFGKNYFLLMPLVATWARSQPSLKKFVKKMHIYLYKEDEGGFGLWLVRDSLDSWSVSERAVVNTAKTTFTRRYSAGKVRKAHTSDAIDVTAVEWPDKSLTGAGGLLSQAFGEAFVITSIDHPVLVQLMKGKSS